MGRRRSRWKLFPFLGRSSRPKSSSDPALRALGFFGPAQQTQRVALVTLLLAALLGGGTRAGLPGDLVVQMAGFGLLAIALIEFAPATLSRGQTLALALMGALVAYGVLQALPLPYAWWRGLPGHQDYAAALDLAGSAPAALPLSLTGWATERALWTLVPALGLLLACAALDRAALERLTRVIVVAACANVLLGFAQVGGGPDSPLRFYVPTNTTEAVGFFANRNHYAALLLMALPLAAGHLVLAIETQRRAHEYEAATWPIVAAGMSVGLLLLGLFVARSRAGLLLGMLALAGVFVLLWRGRSREPNAPRSAGAGRVVGVAAIVALMLGVQLGFFGVLQRLGSDPLTDWRVQFGSIGVGVARAFAPFGAGLGAFVPVFEAATPPQARLPVVANHAHDDWLEWVIELGVPGALLIGALVVLVAIPAVRTWRSGAGAVQRLTLPRAASLSLLLVLLHSAVDYPLRTTANMCVCAVLVGLIFASARQNWLEPNVPRHSTPRMLSWHYENHPKNKQRRKAAAPPRTPSPSPPAPRRSGR